MGAAENDRLYQRRVEPYNGMKVNKINSNKIILDLCGGSGSWSRPYAQAGYDVRLITLPMYDVLTFTPPMKTSSGYLPHRLVRSFPY